MAAAGRAAARADGAGARENVEGPNVFRRSGTILPQGPVDIDADLRRGLGKAILFASALDFVNVRPSRLTNGPARGNVKAFLSPEELRWWPLMTREDLAAFMVDQLTDDTWLRQSPLIGY